MHISISTHSVFLNLRFGEYNENFTNTYATGGNRPEENEEQDERPRQQVSCQNQ